MAYYPSSVASFSTHLNITEIIDASHPNSIQTEVVATQTAIGTTPSLATAATATGWANTATDYTTITARLANIEKGIVADAHTQYIKNSIATATGDILYASGSGAFTKLSSGSAGTFLQSNGAGVAPSWATVSTTDSAKIPLSTVTTSGDLIVASGSSAVTRLPIGASGTILYSNGSAISWQSLGTTTAADIIMTIMGAYI
jgi:hypothetical protein